MEGVIPSIFLQAFCVIVRNTVQINKGMQFMIIRKEEINPINFSGLSLYDYTSKCKEKSSFAVINVPINVGHQLSWSKRSDKFYYILEGKLTFTINDENHVLNKGDFCIIKKGEKFKYKNNFNGAASLILVHTPNFLLNEEVFE
jgi:mannose-6-phosphate isomerase-like protein (cupin superfamily)